jgi:hypothetical protein
LVYIYSPIPDVYDSVVLAKRNDWRFFDQFTGKPFGNAWKPIRVRLFKSKKRGDFPMLSSHVPVFSERAWKALESLVSRSGEALPLDAGSETLYAINVLAVLDCLDMTRSDVDRYPSGGISYINRYAFKPGWEPKDNIFKVRGAELKEVLVSEAFKNQVEQDGLQGLAFRSVG